MAEQKNTKRYREEALRILGTFDKEAQRTIQAINTTNPQWMFYLPVGGSVDMDQVAKKLGRIEHLARQVLKAYDWPDRSGLQEPRGFYGERSSDWTFRPIDPDWQPQPGEGLRHTQDNEPKPFIDLRWQAFRTIEAIAAFRFSVERDDLPSAVMAAAAALGFIMTIEHELQEGDLIVTALAVTRRGQRIPAPDEPPAGYATLAEAARKAAEGTGLNPESIERRWRRKGILSPRPFRKPASRRSRVRDVGHTHSSD
ncbi:MAG TPA: hypothetical protein VHL31_19530 [Geminicoccus sp.]|jgi:hypothetical protein|uniref:hypothetical protein n=1 Tax=Geminicoccus sp. TaxID=2024832 RepID=UPI002E319543|nr:hypothetical protein [Geminicoccus sp.]HEX2528478.1 hypothetical protein [Geminicoccus sp.]